MVRPVDPSNPTSGDGNEKYNPNPKRGPGFFDEVLEKAKSDRKPSSGGGSGSGGSMTDPMERKTKPYNKAKGGVIKSASKRADGCAIKGKTRGRMV
jgi:hypothetical protein